LHRFIKGISIWFLAGFISAQSLPFPWSASGHWGSMFSAQSGTIELNAFISEGLRGSSLASLPILLSGNPGHTAPNCSALLIPLDSLLSADTLMAASGKQPEGFTIDSLRILLRYKNLDLIQDSLRIQLMWLNDSGFPIFSAIKDTTIVLPNSLPPDSFQFFSMGLDWGIPPMVSAGIWISNAASSLQDSVWIMSGAYAPTNCLDGRARPEKARIWPSVYGYYPLYQLWLPSEAGGDLYLDCDSNGLFDSLLDGENPIQALHVSLFLKGPDLKVNSYPSVLKLRVYPCPGNQFFELHTSIFGEPLYLRDVYGRLVYYLPEVQPDGRVVLPSHLPEGLYFVEYNRETTPWIRVK
jgi:hypothetical protein